MRWKPIGWLGSLALLFVLSGCRPQVEVVEVISTQPATNVEIPVTRLVFVTPEGVGPATPGTVMPFTVTPPPTPEPEIVLVDPPPVGSPERPIRLLFAVEAPVSVLEARAGRLREALATALDLSFVVEQMESHEAIVAALCASPADTVGFLPPMGYLLANERCEAQAAATALQFELPWQMGMLVARRDSGLGALEELDGKRWARAGAQSLTKAVYFESALAEAGVEPAEILEYGSENSALLAVFAGEADFASASFLPPILPYEEREWVYGEDEPEIWRRLGLTPVQHPVGYVVVFGDPRNGGYRVRDARAGLLDVEPGIFSQTGIIALSEPIPNTTIAFGGEMPLALARALESALLRHAASPACSSTLCADDFFNWDGLAAVEEAAFDPLRFIQDALALPASAHWEVSN